MLSPDLLMQPDRAKLPLPSCTLATPFENGSAWSNRGWMKNFPVLSM
jgi:hypothetical protein